MKGVIYKLKKGKETVWRAWLETSIHGKYRNEALKSLKEEKCTIEIWTVFKIGKSWYTMGMNDAKAKSNKEREVNKKHKAMKAECFDSRVGEVESIFDLR